MKKIFFLSLLVIIVISCVNDISNDVGKIKSDKIFQYSTKNALLKNDYTGNLTVAEIKKYGDFGLGTFNMVNGEMVIFNGVVYQVLTSGKINIMPPNAKSPFVVTKFFLPDTTFAMPANISLDSVKTLLLPLVESKNFPLAIKMTANFSTLKSRSVDKVADETVTLAEIIANQTIFEFKNVAGTIIGFWYPDYFDGVNFPGFHLHVLLDDFSGGGHLLNCTFENVTVKIDYASDVNVAL